MKKDVKSTKKDTSSPKIKKAFTLWFYGLSKARKILSVSLTVFLLLCVIASVLIFVFREEPPQTDEIFYYPESESTNIFENKAYMSFVRDLRYSYGGVEQLYNYETDYESGDLFCKFFLDYFKTVINGDEEKLVHFYEDGYFKTSPEFSMQMIYEPYVRFHSEEKVEIDGEEVEIANFEVRYKIFKNNGSFRKGVASNQAIPQIYQLAIRGGKLSIVNILDIVYEDEE